MNKIIYSVLLIVIATVANKMPAFAQNQVTNNSTTLIPYYRQWEQKNYKVQRQQQKTIDGKTNILDNATYQMQLTVVDAATDHYIIDAKYTNFEQNNEAKGNLFVIPQNLKVTYATNELGTFFQIMNWETVSDTLQAILTQIAQNNPSINADQLAEEKQKLQSQDYLEEIFIKDIRLLHLPYGMEYQLQKPIIANNKVPNLLGGKEPFPGIFKLEMTELKPANNWCKIVMQQSLDQQKLQPMLNDFAKEANANKPAKDKMDIPTISSTDTNEFEADLQSGWLLKASFRRNLSINNTQQTDAYIITLLP